jgi:hypothetical protein
MPEEFNTLWLLPPLLLQLQLLPANEEPLPIPYSHVDSRALSL